MKSFLLFKLSAILFFLFVANLSGFPQNPNYPVSQFQLIVGDTCILHQEVGYCDTDKLVAMLSPRYLYWPEYCPGCMPDTLYSFRTESVPDTDTAFYFYFILPMGTLSGSYDVFYLCDGSPMPYKKGNITVYTPPFVRNQPRDTIVCAGNYANFSVTASGNRNEDLTYEWYHDDSLISSTYDSTLLIEIVGSGDTGKYHCVISNQYGSDTSQTVTLDLHPFPDNPGTPVGPDGFCGYVDSSDYTIPSDPLANGYSWKLIPEEAGTVGQIDTSCTIFWNEAFSGVARLFVELISGNCGKNTSDTLEITIPGFSPAPEICIVGIDQQTGKYRITWERSAYGKAILFRIYRESNQADVYLEIGTVDTSKISYFVDSASVPDVLPHRYKMSYLDSCGLESEISPYHQTMHLVANIGINSEVNLIWSEYKGIPFPTYTIYRGNHPDSMGLFIQVPSTVTSYKDLDPPAGKVYYQIGMSNPAGCDPVKKSESDYSSSLSNMSQVLVNEVNNVNEGRPFKVFPNPATDVMHIAYYKTINHPLQLTIHNSLGKAVLEEYITANDARVDVGTLKPGLYILKLSTDAASYLARFVIIRK